MLDRLGVKLDGCSGTKFDYNSNEYSYQNAVVIAIVLVGNAFLTLHGLRGLFKYNFLRLTISIIVV